MVVAHDDRVDFASSSQTSWRVGCEVVDRSRYVWLDPAPTMGVSELVSASRSARAAHCFSMRRLVWSPHIMTNMGLEARKFI